MVVPKLEMVTFNHIQFKTIEYKASPLIQNILEVYHPAQQKKIMVMKMLTLNKSGTLSPMVPLLLRISRTDR